MKSDESEIEQDRGAPDELTALKHRLSELEEALQQARQADQPSRRQRWISNFAAARSIATSVLVLAVIVGIIWSATPALLSQAWLVRPIQVPAPLVDQGFQPDVVAQHLMDELRAIQEASGGPTRAQEQLPLFIDSEATHDIRLPGVGFSLSSALSYVRRQTVISGEILNNGDELRLRIRITPRHGKTVKIESKSEDDILELLNGAARQIMEELDPLILAQYLSEEDPEEVLSAVSACFHNDSPDDDAPALVLWGQVLLDGKEFDAAMAKAEEALQLDSNLWKAYSLQADVHFERDEHGIALETYREALRLNSESAYLVNQVGRIYLQQEDFPNAEEQFREALTLQP